jgi:hypothetical protein
MNKHLEEEIIDEILRNETRGATLQAGPCSCFTLSTPWPDWVPELARRSPDEALRLLGSGWGGLAPRHAEAHLEQLGLNTGGLERSRGPRWKWSGAPEAAKVFVLRGRGPEGAGPGWLAPEFLAPGDVILLSGGELVPADLRLLRVRELRVDEGALTGDPSPVAKDLDWSGEPGGVGPTGIPDLCFRGTRVVSGTATALVVATGPRTLEATLRAS